MTVVQFPTGMKIRTFPPVPAGFNPLKADDDSLIRYGFPRRPVEDKALVQLWERVLGRVTHFIQPSFRRLDYMRTLPGIRTGPVSDGKDASHSWSGAIVYPPNGKKMLWVYGEFNVPNPSPPPAAGDGDWYSSSWVGLDGFNGTRSNSTDVFQTGVQCNVSTVGGVTMRDVFAWTEWYPEGTIRINFPVSPGDQLACLVCAESSTAGNIYFANKTNGVYMSFHIEAPKTPATMLKGDCAEWIVERPGETSQHLVLANYGSVSFGNATAQVGNGATLNAGSGDTLDMIDKDGRTISSAAILAADLVRCTYDG